MGKMKKRGTRRGNGKTSAKKRGTEMEATAIATQSSAVGRVSAEHYFEEVLEDARLIEAQCSKSIMF